MIPKSFSLLFTTLVIATTSLPAQPTCYSDYGANFYEASIPATFPPLHTGMSYELMLSHIVLDSVCRESDRVTMDSVFGSWNTYDDTLKTVIKHALHFIDADPITAHTYSYNDNYHIRLKELKGRLANLASSLSPTPGQDLALLSSDYILEISVSSVSEYEDTSAYIAYTVVEATAFVEDTVLGQVLPPCQLPAPTPALTNPTTQQCISIDIRRQNVESYLRERNLNYDTNDVNQLMPMSGTYLVFLKIVNLCYTDSTVAYFVTANPLIGERRGVYKVDSAGNISDPTNFFGHGMAPSLQSVIAALKTRKSTIMGY